MYSLFSLKIISNLSKMSILPNKRGTSSINAHANRILNFLFPNVIRTLLTIYGTPPPETPFISNILSEGFCLNPKDLPKRNGIIVISAPESMYIEASTFILLASNITFAIGRRSGPKLEGS